MLYLLISVGLAAWPDAYDHRIAAMEALRYDLAMPGIPYREAEVLSKYKVACDKGYTMVCTPEKWMTDIGGDASLALARFESKCQKSNSPLPCVVTGMAYGMIDEEISASASNPVRAFQAFQSACKEKAYAPGCTYLGDMYAKGVGVEQDLHQAEKKYKEACSARDIWGCHRLADLYGEVGDPDNKRLGLYDRSCQDGYALGCIAKALIMIEGATKASEWSFIAQQLEVACRFGQLDRCADLAVLYHQGKGVRRSVPTAMALYQSTCATGTATSCHALGELYFDVEPPQYEKAAQTFFDACEGGYSPSCTRYGSMVLTGLGTEGNLQYGLRYMNRGCEAGDLEGCLVLAEAYAKGMGVEQDVDKATALSVETCDADYGRGCYALALLNEGGDVWGQESQYDSTMLYQKSCDLGDGRGCSELALREVAAGRATPDVQEKLKVGCQGEDSRACMVLADLLSGIDGEEALSYWLQACDYRQLDGCLRAGTQYQRQGDIPQAARYFERVCSSGDDRGCDSLGPIAFQGRFESIVVGAFTNNLCQVWARPEEDNMMLFAEAKGASINLHSGNYAGSQVSVWHLGNKIQLEGIQRGESQWNVGGVLPNIDVVWGQEEIPDSEAPVEDEIWGEQKAMDWDFTVKHVEEWDPSKGSVIRNFPASEATLVGDKGVLVLNRDTGVLTGGCGFPMKQAILHTEHCSEIQALIIGYALLGC